MKPRYCAVAIDTMPHRVAAVIEVKENMDRLIALLSNYLRSYSVKPTNMSSAAAASDITTTAISIDSERLRS